MDFQTLLHSLNPSTYHAFKRAIEIGKWPNGQALTREQTSLCMQAVIAYEEKNSADVEKTGYVPPKPHSHCGGEGEVALPDEEQALRWR